MPSHIPGKNPLEADETHEDERVPSSGDRDQLGREGTKSKNDRGHNDATHDQRSQDTDPDSPDADIDRDDMIDEP